MFSKCSSKGTSKKKCLVRLTLAIVAIGFGIHNAAAGDNGALNAESLCGPPPSASPLSQLLHKAAFKLDPSVVQNAGFDQQARVQMACEMKNAFISIYALFGTKNERLGLNLHKHFDNSVLTEARIDRKETLEFLDRMRFCVAGLKDTHVTVTPLIKTPTVTNGLWIRGSMERFFISQRSDVILRRLATRERPFEMVSADLALGSEVVQVDGVPVLAWVQSFERFVSASSDAARREQATTAVFWRDFKYPVKSQVTVKLASGRIYNLPWYHTDEARADALIQLRNIGIANLKAQFEGNLNWVGYSHKSSIIRKEELREEWKADNGSIGLRLGQATRTNGGRNERYCYLQLLTYSTQKWQSVADNEKYVDFLNPIRPFITDCETQKLPLLLDLRANPGGRAAMPAQLLSILTEKNKTYPGRMIGFRATPHSFWLLSKYMGDPSILKESFGDVAETDLFLEVINTALLSGEEHTDLILSSNVTADPEVGGYHQKIVALISPECVSACDITAALLKNSRRATLLGQPTSGTGAGFYEWNSNGPDANWKSSAYEAFQVRIPNFLFGVPKSVVSQSVLPYSRYQESLLENRPTHPDILFTPTVKTFKDENTWRHLAEAELF